MGTYDRIAERVERELRDGLSRRREGIIDDDVSVRSVGDRVVLSVAYGRRDTHEIELFDGKAIPLAVEMPRRVPQDVEWQLESVCRKGIDAFVGFAEDVPELKEAVAAREGRLAEAKGMEDAVKAMLSSDGWRSARSELRALREAGDPEMMVGVPYEYVVDRIDTDVDPSSLAATVTVTYQGIYDDDPGDHYNYGFRFKLFDGHSVPLTGNGLFEAGPEFRDLGEGDRWTSWGRGDRHNPPDAVSKAADGFAAAAREAFAATAREFVAEGRGPSVLKGATVSPAAQMKAIRAIYDGDAKALGEAIVAGADFSEQHAIDVGGKELQFQMSLMELACSQGQLGCVAEIARIGGAATLYQDELHRSQFDMFGSFSEHGDKSPLMTALLSVPAGDMPKVVEVFRSALDGASIEVLCGKGTTPLHRVAELAMSPAAGRIGVDRLLAAAGALVAGGHRLDAVDSQGFTPVGLATKVAMTAMASEHPDRQLVCRTAWSFASAVAGKEAGLWDMNGAVRSPDKVSAFISAAGKVKDPNLKLVATELVGWAARDFRDGLSHADDARRQKAADAFAKVFGKLGKGPVAEAFLARFPEAAAREIDGVSTVVWKDGLGYKALAVAPNGEASVLKNPLPTMKAAASAAMQGLSYDPWTAKPESPRRGVDPDKPPVRKTSVDMKAIGRRAGAAAADMGKGTGRKGPGM